MSEAQAVRNLRSHSKTSSLQSSLMDMYHSTIDSYRENDELTITPDYYDKLTGDYRALMAFLIEMNTSAA